MKAMLLILTILMFSLNGFAKTKQRKVDKNVLQFNFALYKKMKVSERSQYLKALYKLVEAKSNEQNGKTAAFDFYSLFIPSSYAVDYMCFNGGLAYSIPNGSEEACSSAAPPTNANALVTCPAGQQRCSLALGLTADNRGACWSSAASATTQCRNALGTGALTRLEAQLSQCVGATARTSQGIDCRQLNAGLTADTAQLGTYCGPGGTGRWKTTCEAVQREVSAIQARVTGRPDPASPTLDTSVANAGCASAEYAVLESAYRRQSGQSIDPRWLSLVSLTQEGCSLNDNFNLISQLEKFGACTARSGSNAQDVERALQARPTLASALQKIRSGQTLNAQEIGQFRDFYGITPVEFRNMFCNSSSTLDFAQRTESLRTSSGGNNQISQLVTYLLAGGSVAREVASGIQDADVRAAVTAYYNAKQTADGLKAQLDLAVINCGAPNNDAMACSQQSNLRNQHTAALRTLSDLRTSTTAALTGRQSSNMALAERRRREVESFTRILGEDGMSRLQTAYNQEAQDRAIDSGGATAEANRQRERFLQCTQSAMTIGTSGSGASLAATATSNFSGCTTRRLNALNAGQVATMFGSYFLKARDGSQACWVASGEPYTNNSCASRAAIRVVSGSAAVSGNTSDRREVCVDEVISNYTAYEVTCRSTTPSQTGGECNLPGGGTGVLTQNPSTLDWSCGVAQ